MSTLTIAVLEVTESPRHYHLESDPEWWEATSALLREPQSRLARAFVLDFEAYRLGRRLILRGGLNGAIEIPCGRCVEPYTQEFREPLELLLEPLADPRAEPPGGIELDPEELELARYAGDELDLGGVLREILSFAWPMQPLCRESCLGLCPRCGANLNQGACGCPAADGARPFADLAQMIERAKTRTG